MPVAERLYYADSFLKNFTAVVTDVREVSRSGGASVWQMALNRTAFYPTSGGQPFDTGVLRATAPSGSSLDIPVDSVEEDEAGEIWHFAGKPLALGTEIEAEIDWRRRLDHMQQHTGQHLLSAIFLKELNAPTVSFHLGEQVSTIDLAGAAFGEHALVRTEELANQIIAEDRQVAVQYVARAEAEAMLASGDLRKLPDREGHIRLIEITDCDRNACGGTHVRSTGQIGGLLIRGTEKVSRGGRVAFVCGLRAANAARTDAAILSELKAALSVGAPEIPAAVERLKTEAKASAKASQRLREDLADYHAARLAVEVPLDAGLRIVERSWKDRDRDYVRLLASRLTAAAPGTVAILSAEDGPLVRVFLARSMDLDINCGNLLKEVLAQHGLRGGGSPDLAQGDVPAAAAAAIRSALAQAVRGMGGSAKSAGTNGAGSVQE
ncbi:MAG TPA: DHHA1 domain-containing protein [Acidobacteriaceae bacterium]